MGLKWAYNRGHGLLSCQKFDSSTPGSCQDFDNSAPGSCQKIAYSGSGSLHLGLLWPSPLA
jgi:hypothetical protein